MNVVLLLVVQRVLFALISVAVVNVMFTALQSNLQGAGPQRRIVHGVGLRGRATLWGIISRSLRHPPDGPQHSE